MIERLWHSIATGFCLQIVVANLLGAVDGFLDVAILKRAKAFVVMVSPYTSVEVSKQLQTYTQLVGLDRKSVV